MSTRIFASAVKFLWGITLLGGMHLVVPRAGAQAPFSQQLVLSPSAKQAVFKVLSALPPYARQLWWNSVQLLGPERAEAYLSLQNSKPPVYLQAEVRQYMSMLQLLHGQYRQTFMNGVVGVTQTETNFVAYMMLQRIRQNGDISRINALYIRA